MTDEDTNIEHRTLNIEHRMSLDGQSLPSLLRGVDARFENSNQFLDLVKAPSNIRRCRPQLDSINFAMVAVGRSASAQYLTGNVIQSARVRQLLRQFYDA